jgi:hypothetical protein
MTLFATMSQVIFCAIAAVAFLLAGVLRITRSRQQLGKLHIAEPPMVRVGILDLVRHGTLVLDKVALDNIGRFPDGIFTASIFGWKAYVINDSHTTTTMVQAKSKNMDFGWVPFFFLANMGSVARRTLGRLLAKDPEKGDVGFKVDFHDLHVRELALGTNHQSVMAEFTSAWEPHLQSLRSSVQAGNSEVDLWQWLRQSVAISVARGIWGPRSPFTTDPELWKEFWGFIDHYHPAKYLTSSIIPWRGVRSRDKMINAFVKYMDEGGFEEASNLSKARDFSLEKRGLNKHEMARCAISMTVGQCTPAAAAFDVIAYIMSYPGLVDRIHDEFRDNLTRVDGSTNLARAADDCPLLLSTIHEVLRIVTLGATVRNVVNEHTLTVKGPHETTAYLLRKGRLVWSSGVAIHTSPALFKNPEKFDPERFLGKRFPETQTPGLFRAFGSVCLGRHLLRGATATAVASLLHEFDFAPTDEGEELCLPNLNHFSFDQAAAHPRGNTRARLHVRHGQLSDNLR